MLRKLSLVAVAAASLAAAAWRRPPPLPGAAMVMVGTVGGMAAAGRSPFLRRWPGLLSSRLWRLLRATIGPDAVGSPVAPGESLLLNSKTPRSRRPATSGRFRDQ